MTGDAKDGSDDHSGKCRGGVKGRRRSAGALKPLSSSFINSRDCCSPSPVTPKTLGMKRTLNGNRVPNGENRTKDNIVMAKRQTVLRKQKVSSKCLHLRNRNAYNVEGRIPVKRLKGDKITPSIDGVTRKIMDDRGWAEKQATVFTQWLNFILVPQKQKVITK